MTYSSFSRRFQSRLAALMVLILFALPLSAGEAKHIILMIADGAGFNVFDATSYYQHGELGKQAYDSFPVKYGCTTFSYGGSYDPEKAWADFDYLKRGATDSGASATALNTGVKTRNGRICVGPRGEKLTTIADCAAGRGMYSGAISSVPISHATPAAVAAHNETRKNYAAIANEMIFGSDLNVIMGGGHPLFGNSPTPRKKPRYRFVGGQTTWKMLTDHKTGKGWKLIQTAEEFVKLAETDKPPARVIGVPRVSKTLQSDLRGKLNNGVPTLETMTHSALNVLKQNDAGFFLMIEGGAVDWANHNNNLNQMVEEMSDFNRAVEAVVAWVESESSWDETLLIVTADHDCGYIWGPDSGKPNAFKPVANNGRGKLPGAKYHSKNHSNALVPLLAKGAGSETFSEKIRGEDKRYGEYVDNTDIFHVMKAALPECRNCPHETASAN